MGARLTRLRIAGFKSFAEAASLDILPGLTGIVGPNGCGKSNVVEALRWAMGESSARSLRGGEMDDLIFAGTVHRAPHSVAEVTLTLEDAAGLAPPPLHEQGELAVSRQIERGAGSAYRINGRETRARDIQTLFADLASGARSSAMVSQGRVAALVGARPDERRSILEEAAGITGLHSRRREAELKLQAAEANLARAEDLRRQTEARLADLTTQASQARQYREVAAGLRDAESGLLALLHARAWRDVRATRDAATHAQATRQKAAARAQTAAAAEQQAHADLARPTQAESQARAALERQRIAAEIATHEQARAAEDAAEAQRRLHRSQADAQEAGSRLQHARAALARTLVERQSVADRRRAIPARLDAAEQALGEANAAQAWAATRLAAAAAAEATARSAAEQNHRDHDAAARRLEQVRGQLASVEAEHASARRHLPPEDALNALAAACDDADLALEQARAEAEQAAEARNQAAREAEAARLRAEDVARTTAACQRAEHEARERLRRLDTERAMLGDQAERIEQALVPHAERVAARQQVQSREAALAEARTALDASESANAAAVKTHVEVGHNAAKADLRRQQLEQARDAAAVSSTSQQALEQAQTRLAKAQSSLADANQALTQADSAHRAAGQIATEATREHAALQAARAGLEAEVEGLSRAIDSAAQPGIAQSGAIQSGAGQPGTAQSADDAGWPSVAQTLPVPPGLELAVASVLADGLQAALDEAAPRHWRPLDSIVAQTLPGGATPLSTMIDAPPALARLLAQAGLIEAPEQGRAMQGDLMPGQCLVARDGRLWRWDGFCIADATSNAGTVLVQRNQRAAARGQLDDIVERMAATTAREAASALALATQARQAADVRQAREDAEREATALAAGVAGLAARHAAAEARLHTILPPHDAARQDANQALAELADLTSQLDAARHDEARAGARQADAKQVLQQAEDALQAARDRDADVSVRHSQAESRRDVVLPQQTRLAEEYDAARSDAARARAACDAALPVEGAALEQARAEQAAERARTRETHARQGRQEAESRRDRARAEHAEATTLLARQHNRIEALLPRLAELGGACEQAFLREQSLRRTAEALADTAPAAAETALAREALAAAVEHETTCREARAHCVAEAASLDEGQDRLAAAHDEWARAEAGAAQQHAEALTRLATETEAQQALINTPADAEQQRARQAQALMSSEQSYASARSALDRSTLALTQAQAEGREADGALSTAGQHSVRLQGRAEQAQAILAQLLADTDNPPTIKPDDLSEATETALRQRISSLVQQREAIGPVNLRADIEQSEAQARADAIAQEAEHVESAIARLRGSIGHLNREGRDRLMAVFVAVDKHFQALFARMFNGGRAYLGMVGDDDPLSAGLEIYVQPPGKKLATLSLLSGGEQALTALSLIFAVFRCNPAPVCVLDEVDAPLDDANVARFTDLLSDMVADTGTRFLVVTHHQLTMARMDRLYGVTMQERGISHVLSIDLTAATGMAASRLARA